MSTKDSGFTLIETVIFIVIVSIAVAAISNQISQNVEHSADPLLRQRAIAIAHLYLDRMQGVRWDETTPVGGGTSSGQSTEGLDTGESCNLAQLDDFDDFDCFSDEDLGDGFTLTITVENGTAVWDSVPANKHKKAVISVTTPINDTLKVTLYRADY